MSEKECLRSPDGKHHYQMLKSGMCPVYGCKYCQKARPETIWCPHCGHPIEIDARDIWSHL
jgi:hypothetical protein